MFLDSKSGLINVTKGTYSKTGPRCMLKQIDGLRAGRCYDSQQDSLQPGGITQVYPCLHQWFQFVSFGDGEHAPLGSLYSIIPTHIVNQIKTLGHAQSPYMCFGVHGRGSQDEVDWVDEDNDDDDEEIEGNEFDETTDATSMPLSYWQGEQIVTTQCSNKAAVIEWVFVPYIVEEDANETDTQSSESEVISNEETADHDDEDAYDEEGGNERNSSELDNETTDQTSDEYAQNRDEIDEL